jgi:hypothetical protein
MTATTFEIVVHDCLMWFAIETADDNPEAWLASTTSVPVER